MNYKWMQLASSLNIEYWFTLTEGLCPNPRLTKSLENLRPGIFGIVFGEPSRNNDHALTLYRSQWVAVVLFVNFFPRVKTAKLLVLDQ